MSLRACRALVVALALAASHGVGCREKRADEAALAPLDFAGCAAVVDGPVCELAPDRALTLRVPDALANVEVGFVTTDEARAALAGGRARRVVVPPAARAVVVHADDRGRRARWTLAVRDAAAEPAVVVDARALREKGALDDAAASLATSLGALDGAARAMAASALARVEIARGASDAAQRRLAEAIELHAAVGRASSAVDDAIALVFLLLEQRRFKDARARLAFASERSHDYFEGRMNVRFYEGYLARDVGDVRAALVKLDGAIADADEMSIARMGRIMKIERALTHAEIGRGDEALAALGDVEQSADAPPCQRADAATNVGWIALGLADAAVANAPDPRPPLERALALARGGCRDRRREANVLVNLAWAALQAGDPASARARLADAKKAWPAPDSEVALFAVELDGRIALAENRLADALGAFERLGALARDAQAKSTAWRAADGRAAALAQMGKKRDAIAASAEAERLLDEESRGVPLGEGRAQLLGARDRSARRRVELLVDAGQPAAALAAARVARARVLADAERSDRIAALDAPARARWEAALGAYRAELDALAREAASDWALPSDAGARAVAGRAAREAKVRAAFDEAKAALPPAAPPPLALPAPKSGVLFVAFVPLLRGWAVLATDGGETVAKRIAPDVAAAPDALAAALFGPIRAELARASRVRFVAGGLLDAVDLHALPFDGAPLVARASVEYALDLGGARSAGGDRAPLVVADPTSDLPAARAEGRAVTSVLGDAKLLEGAAATRAAVQAALDATDLFHYAGHGTFGGRDGWASALPLAGDTELAVADIVVLPHAPREIVLAGCDTAASARKATPSAMGVAQAFLAAGSDAVVAATRAVDDAATRELVVALHRARHDATSRDLADALRAAQRDVAARQPLEQWSAFRVLKR